MPFLSRFSWNKTKISSTGPVAVEHAICFRLISIWFVDHNNRFSICYDFFFDDFLLVSVWFFFTFFMFRVSSLIIHYLCWLVICRWKTEKPESFSSNFFFFFLVCFGYCRFGATREDDNTNWLLCLNNVWWIFVRSHRTIDTQEKNKITYCCSLLVLLLFVGCCCFSDDLC